MNVIEVVSKRLPIITIGGFLGAGKTTLVNGLLSQADGKRLVVFVNDFGAINIDHSLVETVEQDRISLKNGCVCCSLNDDLVAGIAGFAGSDVPPDAIVIEASGVADPRALDSSIEMLEAAGTARLDTRVYVLDTAGFGELQYEDTEHIIDHAAASDLILLNKVDLASPEKVASIISVLEESAPFSGLVRTEHCAVSLGVILSDGVRQSRNASRSLNALPHHDHSLEYQHWACETDVLLDRRGFDNFAKLLPRHCLRAKGMVRFSQDPETCFVFNLVGYRATLETMGGGDIPGRSQLVAIGRSDQMSGAELDKAFRATLLEQ